MIHHIVMWKLKDTFSSTEKNTKKKEIKQVLEGLKNYMDCIHTLEVEFNAPGTPEGNFDIMLMSTFESMEALDKYQNHPEHLKCVSLIREAVSGRSCVDYEVL